MTSAQHQPQYRAIAADARHDATEALTQDLPR
jgi:hypothetical protein